MAILAQKLSSALLRAGVTDAQSIVNEVMADLVKEYGGDTIAFTTAPFRQYRNEAIRQQWDGRNTKQLAMQFDITPRRILQILKD